MFTAQLITKRLQLVYELLPGAVSVAALLNPHNSAAQSFTEELQTAASLLGLKMQILMASSARELDAAFETLRERRIGGLLLITDPFFDNRRAQHIALSASNAIATIYAWREDAIAGCLISYGTSIGDLYRQAGVYAGKILKGARPADLPVEEESSW
jgi:putative ABC transport system substrate-binding protein